MPGSMFHPLCARCGAPLSAQPDGFELDCASCGAAFAFSMGHLHPLEPTSIRRTPPSTQR